MNRLHAIDVFEEIKDNQAEGREFCFKLYPSHVSIEPRLPRSTKSTKTRTTEVDMSTPSGRYHIHEVGLRIVNDQKCIIKVKNNLRKSPSRMWEKQFILKVNCMNENIRRKRWGIWREACHRSTLKMDDFKPMKTCPRVNKSQINNGELDNRSLSPAKDSRIRQILQPLWEAWRGPPN